VGLLEVIVLAKIKIMKRKEEQLQMTENLTVRFAECSSIGRTNLARRIYNV
jgi:hypothetical protein